MPKINFEDTIAAVITPPGIGGISVIRVSGGQSIASVAPFFHSSKKKKIGSAPSHTVHHGRIMDEKGNKLDEVLVTLFRAPHSYTGEETVEISCHGGSRSSGSLLGLLCRQKVRQAEPGEFTRRAFLNGKMDLLQAEAVLDLIRAQSDISLQTALRQLEGGLSQKIRQLKDGLLKIAAHFEAGLDFPDERLEVFSDEEFERRIREIEKEMKNLIASFERGMAMREGILVVMAGKPNVGKSSLLNALLEKDRALVSEIPGTTRDSLEETLVLEGWTVRLVDTAGLSTLSRDPLDRLGMERSRRYLEQADLLLFLMDGSTDWDGEDEALLKEVTGKNVLPVINKTDLPQKVDLRRIQPLFSSQTPSLISCVTGRGLEELEKKIVERMVSAEKYSAGSVLTRLRHRTAVEKSLVSLERGRKGFQEGLSAEFFLTDFQAAVDSLRELIGEVWSEDLLDVIFQEFCIGK